MTKEEAEFWKDKKQSCPHDDWVMFDRNTFGNATCAKCMTEFGFPFLVNRWKSRIESELRASMSPSKAGDKS